MQKLSVLIADDDAVIRMDLRVVLEGLGHIVVAEASGGYEAVRLARTFRPSVAILDVQMPGGSGLAAAGVLAKERICPVVLLTAYSDAPLIEEATRAGVLAYVVKPFTREDLAPALQIATARYRELRAIENELATVLEQRETEAAVQHARLLLMRRYGISAREAQRRLEACRLSSGKTLREVAEAVILTAELDTSAS